MAIASITPSALIVATLAIFTLRFILRLLFSPTRHIPGPLLARVTNIYRAGISHTGKACQHYRKWHRKYGTAVRVGPNAISISDSSLIKTIYSTKNAWIKSDMYRPNDILINGHRSSNIFNTASKSFHATYASPIGGFWSNTRVLHLEPLIDDTLSLFTNQLEAWDLSANVTFGEHHGFLEEGQDVKGMIGGSKAGIEYFAVVSQIPWLDEWLDKNPIFRIGPRPLLEGFFAGKRIYERYLESLAYGLVKKGCLPHSMDKYYGLKDTHKIASDEQILNWLMTNVNAEGDSMAGAMRSIAYLVAKHPSVYEKLREELDGAVTTCPAPYQEIKDLPYLKAVILESQRFIAPLGLMLERIVPPSGFALPDGRVIPAGVKVGINPAVITRDTDTFGTDADVYCPERWLQREDEDEDEEAFAKRYRRMYDVADFGFGAGSRICMGKHLVKLVMLKTFATLYSAFDVKLVTADHEWKYNISWFLYQSDIPMTITPRRKF